jgi:DNA-binding HxlR family transcriptional regulator
MSDTETLEDEIVRHLREHSTTLNEMRFLTGEKGHILLRALRELESRGLVHSQHESGQDVYYLQEEFDL